MTDCIFCAKGNACVSREQLPPHRLTSQNTYLSPHSQGLISERFVGLEGRNFPPVTYFQLHWAILTFREFFTSNYLLFTHQEVPPLHPSESTSLMGRGEWNLGQIWLFSIASPRYYYKLNFHTDFLRLTIGLLVAQEWQGHPNQPINFVAPTFWERWRAPASDHHLYQRNQYIFPSSSFMP